MAETAVVYVLQPLPNECNLQAYPLYSIDNLFQCMVPKKCTGFV